MQAVIARKDELDRQLAGFLDTLSLEDFNRLLSVSGAYFTEFEDYIFRNASDDRVLTKPQIEDILGSIRNVFDFSLYYHKLINEGCTKLGVPRPQPTSFLRTSQTVFMKHNKVEALIYKTAFENAGIPTDGFNARKRFGLPSNKYDYVSILIGIACLLVTAVVGFTVGVNSSIQYLVSRILLSIGTSLLLTGLSKDLIEVRLKMGHVKVAAWGAVGIFVLTLFFNPAPPPEYKPHSELPKTEMTSP